MLFTKIDEILSPEARRNGYTLNEPDDHVLELIYQGKVVARFSQTGVTIDNVLAVVKENFHKG